MQDARYAKTIHFSNDKTSKERTYKKRRRITFHFGWIKVFAVTLKTASIKRYLL